MKYTWSSLFLAIVFAIACSSVETAVNNTKENFSEEKKNWAVAINLEESPATRHTEVDHSMSDLAQMSSAKAAIVTKNTTNIIGTSESEKTSSTTKARTKAMRTTTTTSQPVARTQAASKPIKPAFSHDIFDGLLRKHVNSSGKVNYGAFKKDQAKLVAYINVLKKNPPQSNWSENKEMAYWINLYNAFTIQAIVEKYPVGSIMDLEGGNVWDKKKIVIASESLSLNNIEKDKLLKRFKEPRVHFAVNCGAISCPPLLHKAWTEENIEVYYDKQVRAFINNPKHNTISLKNLAVSQIFNWYAVDFGGSDKIISYFQKYSETEIKKKASLSFKEYNWKLNKQ